jgi:hypothetical protein
MSYVIRVCNDNEVYQVIDAIDRHANIVVIHCRYASYIINQSSLKR